MKRKNAIVLVSILILATTNTNVLLHDAISEATITGYSPGLIGELGEASTVLIYSQINATVKVYIPDANWQPTTAYILVPIACAIGGTGFFVNSNGYIVTAGHVIFSFTHTDITQDISTKYFLIYMSFNTLLQALEAAGYHYTVDQQTTLLNYMLSYAVLQDSIRLVYAVLGEVKPTLTEVKAKGWGARVVAVSPYIERDLALLKVEGLTNCPVLVVGDSNAVNTGDSVYMFGFPDIVSDQLPSAETILAPSMTSGIISAKKYTNFQTPCFQTDASLTYGMSGGAGVNTKAEVIGICSRGSISSAGKEAAGFNFLIQSSVLKSLLTESNVNNTLGPVDEAFLKGLNYFYDKHYSAAKAQFEIAKGLFAYHWRAEELISQCNAAIARGEDVPLGFGVDTWMLIIIVIVVVAVVAVLALVAVNRRRLHSNIDR